MTPDSPEDTIINVIAEGTAPQPRMVASDVLRLQADIGSAFRVFTTPPSVYEGGVQAVSITDINLHGLREELVDVRSELEETKSRLDALEQSVETITATHADEIIVLREISKEQARKEILLALEGDEPLDQAELADFLSLELALVVEICSDLVGEEVVSYYDDGS